MVDESIETRFDRLLFVVKDRLRVRDEDAIGEATLCLLESLRHAKADDGEHVRKAVSAGRKSLRKRQSLTLDLQPSCEDYLASCAIVEDVLTVLPEDQRRAFVYHCLDGLSASATAELLGVCERTVYYLIIKAKGRLFKEIR